MRVESEGNSRLVRGSGDGMPSDMACNIVEKAAAMLKAFDKPSRVGGFTDDQPIRT
ncbi:flagellar motor protein MotD, partial [Pseudomonas ogarae]